MVDPVPDTVAAVQAVPLSIVYSQPVIAEPSSSKTAVIVNGLSTYVPDSVAETAGPDTTSGGQAEVIPVAVFEMTDTLPMASVVFIAKAYCVPQVRPLMVIPVAGGVGSLVAAVAVAQLSEAPSLYRMS